MCASGSVCGSPSSIPAWIDTRSFQTSPLGTFEPQREQNGRKTPGVDS